MGQFDGEIRDAEELIRENGEVAELKVMTTTDGPNEWDAGTVTTETSNPHMVFLNFKGSNSGETYFNGQLVHQGDKKVLIAAAATALAPNINALITRADGSVWKVMNLTRLDPNGQQILYTLQVRQ